MPRSRLSILVIGDQATDIDIHGVCERFAQEQGGCPVFLEMSRTMRSGMAEAVVGMVCALGIRASLAFSGRRSVKFRYLVDGRQVWRHDVDSCPMGAVETAEAADRVAEQSEHVDCVLISDYGKGACHYSVVRAAIDVTVRRGIPCLVDPAHGVDWRTYRGAVIKCNTSEWHRAVSDQSHGNVRWWEKNHPAVIVTRGQHGMLYMASGESDIVFPARASRVLDVTGAGDMVLAALGVAAVIGMSRSESMAFAATAAGMVVERRGAVPIPLDDVIAEIGMPTGSIAASTCR